MNKLQTLKRLPLAALCGAALLSAPAAFAGHKSKHRYQDGPEYGEVLEAEPIMRRVRVTVPRQECWDEEVVYQHRPNVGGGALIGAILGGVVGHQFGGGSGQAAATAAGAVVGAHVGADHAARYGRGYDRVGYEERCRTIPETHWEERVDGYDVTYRYAGRVYHTRWPHDPGDRIPLDVNVRPVRYDY